MQKHLLVVLLVLLCTAVGAQDNTTTPIDLQSTDSAFFDPTRKKAEEPYHFAVRYRIEAGYNQNWQRSQDSTYADMYLHGARVGVTFDFVLPYHFTAQAGVIYTLAYGTNTQSWGTMSAEDSYAHGYTMDHRVLEHNITIPVRVFYTIPLWKKLNLFFYTGPQLHIGVAQKDYLRNNLTDKTNAWLNGGGTPLIYETSYVGGVVHTAPYDRYAEKELWRTNIQWGLGGGLEWDKHRLAAGYDFGLNNIVRSTLTPRPNLHEWGWYVAYSYQL